MADDDSNSSVSDSSGESIKSGDPVMPGTSKKKKNTSPETSNLKRKRLSGDNAVNNLTKESSSAETKMPKYELYYFPFKGRGELIRLLLAYGGEEWKDIRHFAWSHFKQRTPFGQVPVLVVDGQHYAQSIAICRYLGHKFGLAGDTPEEDLAIDQNVDFFKEIISSPSSSRLAKLDAILRANNGHLALGKLTWADFVFAGMYGNLRLEKRYPSFTKLLQTVYSLPRVKAYADAAPESSF